MAAKRKKNIHLIKEPDWKKVSAGIQSKQDNLEKAKSAAKKKEAAQILEDTMLAAYRHCDSFAHYEVDAKKYVDCFKKWLVAKSGWDEDDIKAVKKVPDSNLSMIAKPCYIESKLGFMPQAHIDHYNSRKDELVALGNSRIEEKQESTEKKDNKKVISIHERMREQVSELCGDFEATLDLIIKLNGEFDMTKFDPYKEMQAYNGGIIKPNHAKIISDMYQRGFAEAQLVSEWKDPDIVEGYAHFKPKTRKAFLEFYVKIIEACAMFIDTGKAQRKARKPKTKSKEQLLAKLKYKVNDKDLNLVSVDPSEILDSKVLWVFNTKNRKLSRYEADEFKGPISVKGTTLTGFSPDKSKQRTVRKLEDLKGCNKLARTKFDKLYKEMKTVETIPNGRINEHCLLLKAF